VRRPRALLVACLGSALASTVAPGAEPVAIAPGVSLSVPTPWSLASRSANGLELVYPSSGAHREEPQGKPQSAEELGGADAHIAIVVEQRLTHADGVERLAQIAREYPEHGELLTIGGWPAFSRQRSGPLPSPGEKSSALPADGTFITTAIAADAAVVRVEAVITPGAGREVADAALRLSKAVSLPPGDASQTQTDLQTLARLIAVQPTRAPGKTTRADQLNELQQAGSTLVQTGIGELEVVIANNGVNVVVAANSGFAYSSDGGSHFTYGGRTPCIYKRCDGDPSLAIGESGAVYYDWIGRPTNQPGGSPPNGWTDSLSISTNNGQTFAFLSNAVVCPTATPGICTLPDQPHIAADRTNFSSKGQDRVYLAWRNFVAPGETPKIVCSINGGKSWSGPTIIAAGGDFPRITVGSDGFVYVVYAGGSSILINKFSTCDKGLAPQKGFPRTVAPYAIVVCPVAGLDRCDNGNNLSSPMVAVDDTNASHIYVAFATNTAPGNENILVYDSVDGGVKWGDPVIANSLVPGRRFMPWVCAAGGTAAVSWYDRRAATASADDLTAYFRSSAKRVTPPDVLQANPEYDVSGVNDPQCASGWPGGERNPADATSCSTRQLAGECRLPCAATKTGCGSGSKGTKTPCFFPSGPSTPAICKSPEFCQKWGGGAPKYGDYNGNACTPGINGLDIPTICSVWTSGTPAKGVDVQVSGSGLPKTLRIYAACSSMDSQAPPVTITYHQVGACNGFATSSGLVSAGTNFAYVLFGIESIDNSAGTSPFDFQPTRLFVQQSVKDFVDPGLQLYPAILGPFAAVPASVAPGLDLKFSVSAEAALIVSTTNPDGAVEADNRAYFLLYDRKTGDPPVKMVKSDAKQSSWPLTEDCSSISLH
jgi:hypothetical protein